jgi:hypothetical protein
MTTEKEAMINDYNLWQFRGIEVDLGVKRGILKSTLSTIIKNNNRTL